MASKKILFLDRGTWVKLIIGSLVALMLGFFTWYNTVNAQIAARPTSEEIGQKMNRQRKRVKALEDEYQRIRESLAVQKALLEGIRDDIKELKAR